MRRDELRGADGRTDELTAMNARVMVAYIRDQNTGPLAAQARDDFFVVSPVGFEDLETLLREVGAFTAETVEVETTEVRVHEGSAVLAGWLHLGDGEDEGGDGVPRGATREGAGGSDAAAGDASRPARWPAIAFLTVYVREGGRWRLAARSLTPRKVSRSLQVE